MVDVNNFDVRVCKTVRTWREEQFVPIPDPNPLLPPGGDYKYVHEILTEVVYEATLPHQCSDWVIGQGTKEQVTEALAALVIQLSEAMLRLHADDLDEGRDGPQVSYCNYF